MRIKGFTFLCIPTILIAIGLSVAGCSTAADTQSDLGTEASPRATTDESTAAEDGSSSQPWDACPAIVASLNGNTNDPTEYSQSDAASFAVQDVGADVLGGACVIEVVTAAETFTWAILRGDAALAESIKANLLAAGFTDGAHFWATRLRDKVWP